MIVRIFQAKAHQRLQSIEYGKYDTRAKSSHVLVCSMLRACIVPVAAALEAHTSMRGDTTQKKYLQPRRTFKAVLRGLLGGCLL